MAEFSVEDLLLMPFHMGPPLPRFLAIYWPWYEEKLPEEPTPPEPPTPPEKIVLTISATAGGTTIPAPGTYEYSAPTYLGIGAYPDAGYEFVEWQENSSLMSTDRELTVFVETNMEIRATFEKVSSEFYMPSEMMVKVTNGTILDMYWNCEVQLTITNRGEARGIQAVRFWDSVGNIDYTEKITLDPGQSKTWRHSQWIDFHRIGTYEVYAKGDWQGNDYSVGIARP